MGYYDESGNYIPNDDDYGVVTRPGGGTPPGGPASGTIPSGQTPQPLNTTPGLEDWLKANPNVQKPADYWTPPGASYGNDPSGRINQQNPFADPSKPYVQGGTTGGWQDGIGVTIGQGRSITPEQYNQQVQSAISQGVPEAYARDFLERNWGDSNRVYESWLSENSGDREAGFPRGGEVRGSGGSGSAAKSSASGSGQSWGGENWFTDPATSQLETLLKNQLNGLTNPAADSPQAQLQAFLMQRFQELAGSSGYSPQELALLNTQGLEPIEQLRQASQQRELQRTAAAGYLPTSGLTRLNQQQNDTDYDRMRTAASRDLAVQNINERTNRLNQAVQLGQSALNTSRGTDDRSLQLSTLLQQLPIQALQQAMSVYGGTTSPSNLANVVAQMAAVNNQNQQFQYAQQQALWSNIGSVLANLFR